MGIPGLTGEKLEEHADTIDEYLRTHQIKGINWSPALLLKRLDDGLVAETAVGQIVAALGTEYNYLYPKQNPDPRGNYPQRVLYENFEKMLKLIVARRKNATLEIKKPA